MGTFMTKHCSPMSYGTPLEKKSCANYGTPLNQGEKIHTKKVLKEPNLIEHSGLIKPVDISKSIGKLPPIRTFPESMKTSIVYDGKTPKQIRKEQSAPANYGSPLNQFQEQASAKEAPSVAVRQRSTIINPNAKKLTEKQKDSLHQKAREAGKVIYSEKFKVEVDPEDGVLSRMKNPNYKK